MIVSEPDLDPVVGSLLRNRIHYAPDVVARTVLELARAGRLRIEHAEGDFASASVVSVDGDGVVTPWGEAVLDRLRTRALPDRPTPLSVLTTVDGTAYWDWRLRFESTLVKQAERDGLIRRLLGPRQTMAVVCGLTLLAATAVGTVVAVLFRPSPGFGAALATALFGFIVLSVTVGRLSDWRLSASGRRTVHEVEAALATQFESPRSAESAVHVGVVPLPSNYVWSNFGGVWRAVGLGSRFGDGRRVPRAARESLPERLVIMCQVVKHWSVPGGRERDPAYCCAFDDGTSNYTWTFALPERDWHAMSVGDLVVLDFSPRRHRLFQVRRL